MAALFIFTVKKKQMISCIIIVSGYPTLINCGWVEMMCMLYNFLQFNSLKPYEFTNEVLWAVNDARMWESSAEPVASLLVCQRAAVRSFQ